MKNNKAQFFSLPILFSLLIGSAVVLILGIIFKNAINDSITSVFDFLSKYGVYIFASTLILIFKEPIIDFLYFIGAWIKRIF